jgi:phage gpG-like protein
MKLRRFEIRAIVTPLMRPSLRSACPQRFAGWRQTRRYFGLEQEPKFDEPKKSTHGKPLTDLASVSNGSRQSLLTRRGNLMATVAQRSNWSEQVKRS